MSIEAFEGATAVRNQFFKDRQALFAEGAIAEVPWEHNIQGTVIRGVCHIVFQGGHHFSIDRGVRYTYARERKSNRPMASRVPFYVGTQEQIDLFNSKGTVVSHICGESFCTNPDHMMLEGKSTKMKRLFCAGPTMGCVHKPPCLLPGKGYKARDQSSLNNPVEEKHPTGEEVSKQEAAEEESVVFISDDDSDEPEFIENGIADNTTAVVATTRAAADLHKVATHVAADVEYKVDARIQKAEADLERAQKMGNVELELEYIRRLRLLLDMEKERQSTAVKATGTVAVPKLDLTERVHLEEGNRQSKELSSTNASCSSNRILGAQSGSSSGSSNNASYAKPRTEKRPREEDTGNIPPTKKERKGKNRLP